MLASPSRDPRVTQRLKKFSAESQAIQTLENLLEMLQLTQKHSPVAFHRHFLDAERAIQFANYLQDSETKTNLDSRRYEQRL